MKAIDKQKIKLWIEALRSNKYKQSTGGSLSDQHGYSCLGVACKIYEQETKEQLPIDFTKQKTLPENVFNWFGFNPKYDLVQNKTYFDPIIQHDCTVITALSANDQEKWSFDKIANALENRYYFNYKNAVRSHDAEIKTNECTQLISDYVTQMNKEASIISKLVHNLYYNNHYLIGISDITNIKDVHSDIKKLFQDMINNKYNSKKKKNENEQEDSLSGLSRTLGEILQIFLNDVKSFKIEYKCSDRSKAHNLKKKYGTINIPDTQYLDCREVVRVGVANALHNITLVKQWPEKIQKHKEKKIKFLQKNPELNKYYIAIENLEANLRKLNLKNKLGLCATHAKFVLYPNKLNEEKVKQAMEQINPELSKILTQDLIKSYRKFKDKHKSPRKHTITHEVGMPCLEINRRFDLLITKFEHDHIVGEIIFKKHLFPNIPITKFPITIRNMEGLQSEDVVFGTKLEGLNANKINLKGLRIYPGEPGENSLQAQISFEKRVKYPPKFDPKTVSVGLMDLGWYSPTVIRIYNGKSHTLTDNIFGRLIKAYMKIHNAYLKKNKKRGKVYYARKMPDSAKIKIDNIKDNGLKTFVNQVVQFAQKHNLKYLTMEYLGKRSKKVDRKNQSRKQEKRSNRIASIIALKRFEQMLANALLWHGIGLHILYAKDEDKKEEMYYNHSTTCPKCNRLGSRFNIKKDKKTGKMNCTICYTGKLFACVCGYTSQNVDDLATKNMERRLKGLLPSFPPGAQKKHEEQNRDKVTEIAELNFLNKMPEHSC